MRILRKIAKGLGICLVVMVVILIVFYLEEDWRGARDWAKCQRDLAARGEVLDLRTLAPPGDPKDDLSKVPIYAEAIREDMKPRAPPNFAGITRQTVLKETELPRLDRIAIDLDGDETAERPEPRNYLRGEPQDLAAWQHYYRSRPGAHLPSVASTPAQDVSWH